MTCDTNKTDNFTICVHILLYNVNVFHLLSFARDRKTDHLILGLAIHNSNARVKGHIVHRQKIDIIGRIIQRRGGKCLGHGTVFLFCLLKSVSTLQQQGNSLSDLGNGELRRREKHQISLYILGLQCSEYLWVRSKVPIPVSTSVKPILLLRIGVCSLAEPP